MAKRLRSMLTAGLVLALVLTATAVSAQDANALVGQLTKELGVTDAQARGGAGSLFSLAKGKMQPAEFDQVSKAVPGIDGLMKAAPALDAASSLGGQLGTMASAASAFKKLGLDPSMVSKFVPVLTKFVGSTGGPNVASLLAGALK